MMLRLFWWAWLAFYTRHIVAFTATDVDNMVILDDLVQAVVTQPEALRASTMLSFDAGSMGRVCLSSMCCSSICFVPVRRSLTGCACTLPHRPKPVAVNEIASRASI